MTRKERLILGADSLKGLELTGYIYAALCIMAYIKRYDTYWITCYQVFVTLGIIERKGKNTVQALKHADKVLLTAARPYGITVECQDNLAVTSCAECISALIFTAYCLVVVNLTVYGQHLKTILTEQRLAA
jgi:hypothetical protein